MERWWGAHCSAKLKAVQPLILQMMMAASNYTGVVVVSLMGMPPVDWTAATGSQPCRLGQTVDSCHCAPVAGQTRARDYYWLPAEALQPWSSSNTTGVGSSADGAPGGSNHQPQARAHGIIVVQVVQVFRVFRLSRQHGRASTSNVLKFFSMWRHFRWQPLLL